MPQSQRVCKECDNVMTLDFFPSTRSKTNPESKSHRCLECTKDYRKEKNKIYYKQRKERIEP